jgi:hypothetical protein
VQQNAQGFLQRLLEPGAAICWMRARFFADGGMIGTRPPKSKATATKQRLPGSMYLNRPLQRQSKGARVGFAPIVALYS